MNERVRRIDSIVSWGINVILMKKALFTGIQMTITRFLFECICCCYKVFCGGLTCVVLREG